MARPLDASDRSAGAATERLATGSRIVRAADDAAGLVVAERLQSQHRGLAVAERNTLDGMSLTQTADGALEQMHSLLHRLRELAVQYTNGALAQEDRDAITSESGALGAEFVRLATTTSFNGRDLLDGSTLTLQIGANDQETITTDLPDLNVVLNEDPFTFGDAPATTTTTTTTTTTGSSTPGGRAVGWWRNNPGGGGTTTTTTTTTTTPAPPSLTTSMGTIERVDWAIDVISRERGELGAVQNRLEYRMGAIATERESLIGAESRIRDADVAEEVVSLTRARILREAQSSFFVRAQQSDRERALALLS